MSEIPIEVAFRVFPEGDVIAIFVDDICDPHGNWTSYQRVGQHGACSPALLQSLRPAIGREFAPLLKELTGLGYRVNFWAARRES